MAFANGGSHRVDVLFIMRTMPTTKENVLETVCEKIVMKLETLLCTCYEQGLGPAAHGTSSPKRHHRATA